ncbi:hypothetical protein AAVH_11988 [Aphelenchoides avenae]|nr:hypothetical protein AAVH_11988 [Aphelenchus avenae]
MKIRSLAQMVLPQYIYRIRGNIERRTPNALRFLYEALTATNLRRRLPFLLLYWQSLIVDDNFEIPWPVRKDFERPVNADEELFTEIRKSLINHTISDRPIILNGLRHQVYCKYGEAHINALLDRQRKFFWTRFDANMAPRPHNLAAHRRLRGPLHSGQVQPEAPLHYRDNLPQRRYQGRSHR